MPPVGQIGVQKIRGQLSVSISAQGPLIGRWFKGREATIFGIISGTAGLGALLFAPLSQLLIEEWGWRSAYQVLALIVSFLLVPLAILPWRRISNGPSAQGQEPPTDGRWASLRATAEVAVSWSRIVKEPLLWRLLSGYVLTCFATVGIQVLIVVYLVDCGYAPLTAASAAGLASMATAGGVMLFGWLSDRIGWRGTLTASYACSATGILVLWAMSWGATAWLLGLYILTFGLSFGSRGPLIAGLVMKRFVAPATGRVLGMLILTFGIGSASGAWFAGILHEATGGYGAGLLVSAASLSIALLLWWIWPDPARSGQFPLPR
ncbi:MAG: MFS transporter [Alphaproteobacteria bacterium]|nr:MFS transporter [Alphaproteobacteria bacterium]